MDHKTKCNCCDCVWQRVVKNQGAVLRLKFQKQISYKIEKNMIVWLSMESTQRVLFRQRRISICNSIPSRQNNFVPSRYPGTATSYKWALLNDDRIWLL
jgi:hypothetical protein